MNVGHLGDALDTWKGWLMSSAGLAPEVRVLPMFTDAGKWTPAHLTLYSDLIGVPLAHVLMPHVGFTDEGRGAYFREARESASDHYDLFIDPDTGIRAAWRYGDERARLITTAEIRDLLPDGLLRTVAVYRQGRERMEDLSAHIQRYVNDIGHCSGFAVRGGRVTAVFFSRAHDRLDSIWGSLSHTFGPMRDQRLSDLVVADL